MKEDIKKIIATRLKRLPEIDMVIANFRQVSSCLDEFESLKEQLINEDGEVVDGQYSHLLKQRPEIIQKLRSLSTQSLSRKVGSQIKKLERIRTRFSRKEISIQIYGKAGNGKSQLVRSITGLPVDVVPTTDINQHCTGASSYIANSTDFKVHVYFYTQKEILDRFNDGLKNALWINHLKPEIDFVEDFDSIKNFDPSVFGLDSTSKGIDSLLLYKKHFSLIENLITQVDLKKDSEGNLYKEILDKDEIRTYVAQHNGLPSNDPNHKRYYNYLAVHYVKIHTKFEYEDAGDILLMDNVGLGDVVNDASTKQNMYQAVADNSDAVIVLYSPAPMGQSKQDEADLISLLDELRYEDHEGVMEERVNIFGLFLLLNERNTKEYNNVNDCQLVCEKFKASKDNGGFARKETVLIADVSKPDETTNKALIPILTQLLKHLDEIDQSKIADTNASAQAVYTDFCEFCKEILDISFEEPNDGQVWGNIHKSIQNLLKTIETKLGDIYSKAEEKKDKSFSDICSAMENETERIYKYVPKKKDILNTINTMGRDDTFYAIYDREITEIRSRISDAFEEAAITSIKELPKIEVKEKLYDLLFNEARWSELPLKEGGTYTVASEEWCVSVKNDYLKFSPRISDCLDFIVNYSIRIDDYIDYQVETALTLLDPHSNDFQRLRPVFPEKAGTMTIQEHNEKIAEAIYEGIFNHLTSVKDGLKHQFDILALLPYHSVFARIRKFREKLLMSSKGIEELESFYYGNARIFWPEYFIHKEGKKNPISEWNLLVNKFISLQNYEKYQIHISTK